MGRFPEAHAMSLSGKTLLISALALAGLLGLLYGAAASIVHSVNDELVVSYVVVSVVVAGGGFFLVTLLLMHRLVSTRLKRLGAAISGISASGDVSKRLEIDGRDEIGGVALELNALLQQLQQSQQGAHANAEVRPSSRAASREESTDADNLDALTRSGIAAPEEGRTPRSLPSGHFAAGDSPEHFAQLFHSAPVALALCKLQDEQCSEVNDRFLEFVGLRRDDVVGRRLTELGIWDDEATRERWLRVVAARQPAREVECRLRTRGGEARDALASIEWLKLGSEEYFLFAACDLTERLDQEVQLRQSCRMEAVGQLAAGFAHDFNNILAIVQGYTSLLLVNKGLDAPTSKALKEVSAAAERAANLTRQLLLFSRKHIMQPKTLDLNRLLQGLEMSLQRLLGESNALQFNLATDPLMVRADTTMMEQAIFNLAVNARESMPRGGQLSISTAPVTVSAEHLRQKPDARAGRFICLTISDTGCGLEPANLSRIFEPFFSAKGVKGMGLGLSTVYGIVKQHNGWIEVSSQPGKGTTFKIFLPVEVQVAMPKAPLPGIPGGKEKILLVEDEPGLCAMVEGILRRCGYTVVTAPNGVEAIATWTKHGGIFDLLLTDMVMPEGVTGQQLAQKLQVYAPDLKVIYSSGYSVDLVSNDSLDLTDGVNFLQKPYHPHKLAQTVRACLDAAATPALADAVA
jgi:PAS domain S-box-containing protein